MTYSIFTIPPFDKQIKRLVKKYPSLKLDFIELLDKLRVNPMFGTNLGNSCYKIRMAISSKQKGKSGGARIITHILINSQSVYLLAIYDKSEIDTLTDTELKELLSYIQS